MKKLPIGLRLTIWYVAVFTLGELAFGASMWFILRKNLYDIVDNSLESQIEDLKSLMESQKPDASIAKLKEEVAETYSIEHSGDYLAVYLETGDEIYRSDFLRANPAMLLPPGQIRHPLFRSRHADHHHFRFVFQQFAANHHAYTVEMGIPADDAVETIDQFRNYLLMFAPVLLLLSAGGGYWMSRRALAPVDVLVRTAREVGGANLNARLPKLETGDELQRLSDTLNEMLERIETAFLRITQFTADASHELRTPVSLIRTEAELALRRSRNEAEYQDSLRHILLEAERTTNLIGQLLALARADSGREALQLQPLDIGEILRDRAAGWQHVAALRALQFSVDGVGQSVFIMGDPTMVRRLVDILLDNAFKYTPSPGNVRLALESRPEKVLIVVKDSGCGISEEDQKKIFERFFRVDKARSRAEGGTGLGLAIADWIVKQHRGTITVESRLGGGSTFRVELPTVAAPASQDRATAETDFGPVRS